MNNRRTLISRIELLEAARGNVRLVLGDYPKRLWDAIEDLVHSAYSRTTRARATKFDVTGLRRDVRQSLGKKWERSIDGVWDSAYKLYQHLGDLMEDDFDAYFALSNRVSKYLQWLGAQQEVRDLDTQIRQAHKGHQRLIAQTRENGNRVAQDVQAAVGRLESWGGYRLVISPVADFERRSYSARSDVSDPIETFQVLMRTGRRDDPSFTVFTTGGRVENVDDVLDAGDSEFFRDGDVEYDYFRLVSELKEPGSTRKGGKRTVVWTARPLRDRRLYKDAKTVPSGIFVTTDPDRAWGIAHDLGGSEVRDLWRIVINARHLRETLRAGQVRDYQVIGRRAVPIEDIALWVEGSGGRR